MNRFGGFVFAGVVLLAVAQFSGLFDRKEAVPVAKKETPAEQTARLEAQRAREEAAKAKRLADFERQRPQLFAEMQTHMRKREYHPAWALGVDWLDVADEKFKQIVIDAKAKGDAADKAAIKAARRKEGVRVGMTEEEVLDSSWGRPQSVNRTTTARGTREQWVYGGHNYLYFENGVLTAIQN